MKKCKVNCNYSNFFKCLNKYNKMQDSIFTKKIGGLKYPNNFLGIYKIISQGFSFKNIPMNSKENYEKILNSLEITHDSVDKYLGLETITNKMKLFLINLEQINKDFGSDEYLQELIFPKLSEVCKVGFQNLLDLSQENQDNEVFKKSIGEILKKFISSTSVKNIKDRKIWDDFFQLYNTNIDNIGNKTNLYLFTHHIFMEI